MLLAFAMSLSVLGVSVSRHAAYSAAATKAEIERPRTSPLSSAFLYTYAAFSITASPTASLSLNLSNSLKACLKLRSTGSWTWLLLSQVLSLSIVLFIDADNGFPEASLSTGPIIVARPISCIASEVGMPARLLSSCSSLEKARHSGPVSSILSVTTNPQLPQNISPLELSVTIGPFPQRGHLSLNIEISFTNFFHQKYSTARYLL